MKPDIKELYKIKNECREQVFEMMIRSFRNYEKLVGAYPDWDDRQAAIEMVIRLYGAFDFMYGNAYSLDETMREAMMIMYSEEVDYSEERLAAAGCINEAFQAAASRLSEEDQRKWWAFFDEVDRKEAELAGIPDRYLYVDFLCVDDAVQGQGRGSRIIQAACRRADAEGLPLVLFTNGEEDIRFYLKNGFRIIGVTKSEEFGFENTYVMYEPARGGAKGDPHEC